MNRIEKPASEMNPYAPPSIGHDFAIDPALASEAREQAKKLASGGAAVGSISVRLQKLGLNTGHAEQIATEEVLAHERAQSMIGSVILGVGVSMILFAYLMLLTRFWELEQTLFRTFLFLGGGLVMLIGMVKKSSKSKVIVRLKQFGIRGKLHK